MSIYPREYDPIHIGTKMAPVLVQQRSPIFRLPLEIRHHIWTYAVVIDRNVVFREYMRYPKSQGGLRYGNPESLRPNDGDPRQNSLLAIAFTCRQIYWEVSPIYYGENTFQPDLYDHLYQYGRNNNIRGFADAIGPRNARRITNVHVDQALLYLVNSTHAS